MPLPRVGVLCAISGLGGAEFSLLELVTHLRGSYEFHLIVPGDGPLKESAELAGAKVWVLPWPEAIAGAGETARHPMSPVRVLRLLQRGPACHGSRGGCRNCSMKSVPRSSSRTRSRRM
jgi:hypothetical protein